MGKPLERIDSILVTWKIIGLCVKGFVGAFTKLWEACLSVLPLAWNNLPFTEWIFLKFGIWVFFKNLLRKFMLVFCKWLMHFTASFVNRELITMFFVMCSNVRFLDMCSLKIIHFYGVSNSIILPMTCWWWDTPLFLQIILGTLFHWLE
jgi:hypothetical protein